MEFYVEDAVCFLTSELSIAKQLYLKCNEFRPNYTYKLNLTL